MPIITYNEDIPQATDKPSQSQGEILDNFQGINEIWKVNHYTFADNDAGKHTFVELPVQGIAPTPVADQSTLYTFEYQPTGANPLASQLVLVQPTGGARIPISSGSTSAGNGWSWLPSGLLMKWGQQTITTTNMLQTVTYPGSTPEFNDAAVSIMLVINTSGVGATNDVDTVVYLKSRGDAAKFTFYAFRRTNVGNAPPNAGCVLSWLAIGPATAFGI